MHNNTVILTHYIMFFLLLLFMWISFALADSDRTADSERKQKDYGGLVEALLKLLRVILLK